MQVRRRASVNVGPAARARECVHVKSLPTDPGLLSYHSSFQSDTLGRRRVHTPGRGGPCRIVRVHVRVSAPVLKIAALLLLPARMSWRRNVGHVPAVICSTKSRAKKKIIIIIICDPNTHAQSREKPCTRAHERGCVIPAKASITRSASHNPSPPPLLMVADTWRPDDGEQFLACC